MEEPTDKGEIILYQAEDGTTQLDVRLENETVWLTQKTMAELFGVETPTINYHLKEIFASQELNEISVIRKFRITAADGKRYNTNFYNLDAIIAVGYRVNSFQATRFRQWATKRIHEYIVKGFTIDSTRLKETGGGGHFQELLDIIRDIRASEKVMYRQVLQLYALSEDYDANSEQTKHFFKIVQNKIHFAVHKHSASELMVERANAELPFMGLRTFKGTRPIQQDALVAKNYLNDDELKRMNNLVSAYFDIAEMQATNHTPMYMSDYITALDGLIRLTGGEVLNSSGRISMEQAKKKVIREYLKYRERTLLPIEEQYINSIKELKIVEKKVKK